MGAVRSWLLTVIGASLICALAGALMPRGAVRRVGKLVCGLVLIGAVLSPIAGLDVEGGQRWLDSYLDAVQNREEELEAAVESRMKVIIEQEYAAYIVDKAAELGWSCTARVECRLSEDGLYLPARAEAAGPLSQDARARLSRIIAEDLGVSEDRITIKEEELP